ncbi:sensor histidine kinase [Paenibacillus thailandensis]|uniref:Histidine kinase n=1 Tax=Paenibacillus thailandensis TaxID=393250 RepID=A0ABW5R3U2_9BACL
MLRKNSIFIKMLILMLSGILFVSLVLMAASSTISERILLRQVIRNASANMNLAKDELLRYNDQVANAMLQISSSDAFKKYITRPATTPLQQIDLVISLGRYIDLYKDYLSPDHSHIIVSGLPGEGERHYSSNSLKWDKIPQDIIPKYMKVNGEVPNRIMYHASPDLFVESVPYDNFVFATKPLVDTSTGRMYGYAAVVMDELNIFQKYSAYLSEGIRISLVSADGTVLSSADKTVIGSKDDSLLGHARLTAQQKGGIWTEKGSKRTSISYYLPEFDAYLIEEIDQRKAFAPLYSISSEILKVVSVMLAASMLFVYFVSKRITSPLSKLVETMKTSRGDSLKLHPLQEGGSYETNVLTKSYNRMIKEIDEYTERLLYEQQERRKADLNALQMQINPHFLYNTLSSIKHLANMGRTDTVDQTINSLISMLQSTLGSTEDHVTVEEEIETLKHYVLINQVRYGDRIRVHYGVADDCLGLMVPKLIVQPFVENAFFHAFPGNASGNIHIYVRRLDGLLRIEIMDDGTGIVPSPDHSDERTKHHLSGIGIHNVDARVQLLFGPGYGVHIDSEEGYGTSVQIALPILPQGRPEPPGSGASRAKLEMNWEN